MKKNVGGDRLSSLPYDLIHKILALITIKQAIETSALSSRWRYIWTSMPSLNFSSEDFTTLPKFCKFVTEVLSRRNNLTEVYSLKLSFRGKVSQAFIIRILNYAISHNVQLLNVLCSPEKDLEFPLSLVSSQSLKHLCWAANFHHGRRSRVCSYSIIPASSWELPALTTLYLHSVALCDDDTDKYVGIFSKCTNLKKLTLRNFRTVGSNGVSICHPRLSDLTIEHGCYSVKVVNVVAPQLENLTIRFCKAKNVISAPRLASLFYKGTFSLQLSTDGFHSLEKAEIYVSHPRVADAHEFINLFQRLYNVHFLALNLEIVELLSSSGELVLHQPSPFVNLQRLNIYPDRKYLSEQAPMKVAMSNELKSYLLDNSPKRNFIIVLSEEITAHKLMTELQVLLKEEKDNIKTNSVHVVREKAPLESYEPKKLKTGVNMAQIKGHWVNLGMQIQLRKERACLFISKMQRIKDLLTTLPATNRAKMQPCFAGLCEEVNIAISKIIDCMKIQCDENQSRSSIYFHDLATTLESSP